MNVQIFGYMVVIISLIGYFYQLRYTLKKNNYESFDTNFLLFNSISCIFICIYTFMIFDLPIFFYNLILLFFYIFVYFNKIKRK